MRSVASSKDELIKHVNISWGPLIIKANAPPPPPLPLLHPRCILMSRARQAEGSVSGNVVVEIGKTNKMANTWDKTKTKAQHILQALPAFTK